MKDFLSLPQAERFSIVLEIISASPGCTSLEIAEKLGVADHTRVAYTIRSLSLSKQIKGAGLKPIQWYIDTPTKGKASAPKPQIEIIGPGHRRITWR